MSEQQKYEKARTSMAGVHTQLMGKRVLDFSSLEAGKTQTWMVVDLVDVSQYIDCMFSLRIHSLDLSGGTLTFVSVGNGYYEEDPMLFSGNSANFSAAVTSPAPSLLTCGGTVLGSFIKVGIQASKTSAAALSITASLDIVLRTPD